MEQVEPRQGRKEERMEIEASQEIEASKRRERVVRAPQATEEKQTPAPPRDSADPDCGKCR